MHGISQVASDVAGVLAIATGFKIIASSLNMVPKSDEPHSDAMAKYSYTVEPLLNDTPELRTPPKSGDMHKSQIVLFAA